MNKDNTSVKSCQVVLDKSGQMTTRCSKITDGKEPCREFRCRHNIFFSEIFNHDNSHDRQRGQLTPNYTDVSREFLNCSLEVDRPLSMTEISQLYGVRSETIGRIINGAIQKLQIMCNAPVQNNRNPYRRRKNAKGSLRTS